MAIPQKISAESELLIGLLIRAAQAGRDKVPYEELSAVAGVDVTDPQGRGFLTTARNRVQTDHGDVWGTERTVGVYLMPHGERARIHRRITTGVRAKVRKGKKVMKTVDLPSLTSEEMESFNTGRVILSLVDRSASRSVTRRIEEAAASGEARVAEFTSVESAIDFLKKAKSTKKDKEVRPEADPRPPASGE